MADESIEISVKGKKVRVPALNVNGKTIVIRGKGIKVAAIHDEQWLEVELENPEVCVDKLKEQGQRGRRADIFTFTQKVPATVPKYDYPIEWDSVAVAHTSSFKTWWEKLPQESRKNVRRSQKRGVVITVKQMDDTLVGGLVKLNNSSQVRQGRVYTHYGKTFEQVKKDHSSFLERSDFICAHVGDELIGFIKMVYRGEIASILNLITAEHHNDKRPANALIARAVELCDEKSLSYLTYGQFNYGNKHDSPIREFKIRNGFDEFLLPRFYIPLTRWGAICMKLKFHRGLLGILPHSFITLVVGARARWYYVID